MRPRDRRLLADAEKVTALFTDHPHVRLLEQEGEPPDRYVFELLVPGLMPPEAGAEPRVRDRHRVEVMLLLEYPRRPPFCRMLDPVFHPNIDPTKICIGDHWSAGQSLAHLVVRVAEMLAFQSYNVKSPLNGAAAAWAAQHPERLPLLAADLSVGL